uniref:hypothetical protein n=1 Tax=Leisingera sp. F5 TaxID=1813816 RepID=UPI000AA2FA5F
MFKIGGKHTRSEKAPSNPENAVALNKNEPVTESKYVTIKQMLAVSGGPAPRCRGDAHLRDLAHLIAGSAFRNVRYKFVSQIAGR